MVLLYSFLANGLSKSASLNNLSSRTHSSIKPKRSNSGRKTVEQEETLPTDKNGNSDDVLAKDGYRNGNDSQDDVFVVELEKGDSGIGVGLIDGLVRDKFSV